MLWCKCVEKVRDNNGVIESYLLADTTGQRRLVTKDVLKQAILNEQAAVTNLKLSKDFKLVPRSIAEETQLLSQLQMDDREFYDNKAMTKARVLGVAPTLDDDGVITSLPAGTKVIITSEVKDVAYIVCDEFRNKEVVFTGNCSLNIGKKGSKGIRCHRISVNDQTYVPLVLTGKFTAEVVKLDYDGMDEKIVDMILKSYKATYTFKLYYIIKSNRLSRTDAYNRTIKVLKRQKASQLDDRRCHDLVMYLWPIYSLYCSYNDPEILDYAYNYIDEYKDKIYSALRTHTSYSILLDNWDGQINALIRNIENKEILRY